jgi:hypothetical protein
MSARMRRRDFISRLAPDQYFATTGRVQSNL